jgi:hypothetical protein
MPAPLALVVARAAIDENAPRAKLAFGALHAVDPRGDRKLARQLWESAAQSGEDVADLLPLLEPGALAIEREKVPEASLLSAAQERVAREFALQIQRARSAEQRAYFVELLMAKAGEAEEPADQYALLSEACARAAVAGDVPRVLAAVDELARWFEVDALVFKAAALSKTATRNAERAADVARAALALADECRKQGRSDLTRSLSTTAASAARRSRDPELIQRATSKAD